jgi:uncharacterized MAPEG superfamily protein
VSLAYWCVLLAGLMPYLSVSVAKGRSRYDNRDPRKPGLYTGLAYRAYSAHQNGFEAFPFFAAAVFVASHGDAKASIGLLNGLAVLWVACRVGYVAAYLGDRSNLRTVVWMTAFFLTVAIFTMPVWHG